jgi:hypothetical protein
MLLTGLETSYNSIMIPISLNDIQQNDESNKLVTANLVHFVSQTVKNVFNYS